jgi:site-specific DNA-cytosine methylase
MRRFLADGELFDHYTTLHQGYVIDRFREIPEGRNWEAIREQMTTYNSETIDNTHRNIYRRLRRDMPANTISHYRKSMVIHPSEDRGLSFREACRLQSFPDWFRFSGIRGAQQQQLANAVPPLMAVSVAYAIAELFLDETNRKRLVERL